MPIKRGRGRPSSQPTCDALQNCLLNLPAVWTSGTTVPLTTKLLLYGIEVPCKPCGPKCRGITRNPSCLCALQPPKISLDLDEGGTNGIDTGSEDNKKRRKLNSNFPNRACAKRGQIWRHPSLEQCAEAVLGPDPTQGTNLHEEGSDARRSVPAGLRNLGATCYVSSVLQCLEMNTPFRTAVLGLPKLPPAADVLSKLQELFARLHFGLHKSEDPSDLIAALQLDRGVQQDGHEFLKLLLSLLASKLGGCKGAIDAGAVSLVQDLFRGQASYATTCQACGRDSESSSHLSDFYEIELNVRGAASLGSSLKQYLAEDLLEGDNQYQCDFCQRAVDAKRATRLHTLPQYLHFQLKRFVFDMETLERKKAADPFSFPAEVDLGPHCTPLPASCERGESPATQREAGSDYFKYQLAAILMHKGASASHGHYVAHVQHDVTGQWWCFDDDAVTLLGERPFGSGKTAEAAAAEASADAPASQAQFTSTNAYLLLYRRKSRGAEGSDEAKSCSADGVEIGGGLEELPEHLAHQVRVYNEQMKEQAQTYRKQLAEMQDVISARRAEVRQLLTQLPVGDDPEAPFYWMEADWLQSWAQDVTPPSCIDTTSLVCAHGNADPAHVARMKRVSTTAWRQLSELYPPKGPPLTQASCCDACLQERARLARTSLVQADERETVLEMVQSVLATSDADSEDPSPPLAEAGDSSTAAPPTEPGFLVSRAWLLQWRRQKKGQAMPAGPTRNITCPHNGLLPDSAPGAKRVVVPGVVWEYLVREWASRGSAGRAAEAREAGAEARDCAEMSADHPIDLTTALPEAKAEVQEEDVEVEGGAVERCDAGSLDETECKVFPEGAEDTCEVCARGRSEAEHRSQQLRQARIAQRSAMPELATVTNPSLELGATYFVVPSQWLKTWRQFVCSTGSIEASAKHSPPPGALSEAVAGMLCAKHRSLNARLPPVVRRRGKWAMQDPASAGCFYLTSDQWGLVQQFYGRCPNPVTVMLEDPEVLPQAGAGAARAPSRRRAAQRAALSKLSPDTDSDKPAESQPHAFAVSFPSPLVCEACVATRETEAQARLLDYEEVELRVHMQPAPPASAGKRARGTDAPSRVSMRESAGRRTSGRGGGAKRHGTTTLIVSSSTTLHSVKMQMLEKCNVHPLDQEIHLKGQPLTCDTATLAECGVTASDQLEIYAGDAHDTSEAAIAALFVDQPGLSQHRQSRGRRTQERGFMGTGLVGGALGPAPVIDLQERGTATEECAASEDEVQEINDHPVAATIVDETSMEMEDGSPPLKAENELSDGIKKLMDWACEHCTLMNSYEVTECEVCGEPRW